MCAHLLCISAFIEIQFKIKSVHCHHNKCHYAQHSFATSNVCCSLISNESIRKWIVSDWVSERVHSLWNWIVSAISNGSAWRWKNCDFTSNFSYCIMFKERLQTILISNFKWKFSSFSFTDAFFLSLHFAMNEWFTFVHRQNKKMWLVTLTIL